MNSRPLLDYLAYPEETEDADATPVQARQSDRPMDTLEARLKGLEAMLRANEPPVAAAKTDDATLADRIEAILGRKAVDPAARTHVPRMESRAPAAAPTPAPAAAPRMVVTPPPTAPASIAAHAADHSEIDREFLKFTEAVYLIGQAAKRFIELPLPAPSPEVRHVAPPPPQAVPVPGPATAEIEALSAVLRETISAFRSVADDLAVSAGEIRHFATRRERTAPSPRPPRARYRDDEDDMTDLRESVAELQDRLDMMRSRRRARY